MYCPNCGGLNENSYNNCIHCGKYIADINKTLIKNEEDEIKSFEPIPETEKESVQAEKTEAFERKIPDKKYYNSVFNQYVDKPREYLVLSIIATVFGSIAFGIASIIFSVMTRIENNCGNIKKASVYSSNAKMFSIISIVIGVIKFLVIFTFFSALGSIRYFSPFYW